MSEDTRPEDCTHPHRGGQEHIEGFGTGDYHCLSCGEPMPIITKPANCIICLSKTRRIEPEPTYAKSWHCLDCGKNWGWIAGQ